MGMETLRKACAISAAVGLALAGSPAFSWAATDTTPLTLTATITAVADTEAQRDTNSVSRGTSTQVLFDRYDHLDPGVTSPNPGFMYAPYRSETGKNWHILSVIANGATYTLTADVGHTAVGSTFMDVIMDVFCGGFFPSDGGPVVSGTASSDWELLDTFSRTKSGTFVGTAPMNYRLRVSGIAAGSYSGSITYTLTTT